MPALGCICGYLQLGDQGGRFMDDSTMWVPICCGKVMRHGQFPGQQGKIAAGMLTCGSCGKHIALEPQPAASLSDYAPGSRVILLLGTPRAADRKAKAAEATTGEAQAGDETLL
jgi:hypothetical protein